MRVHLLALLLAEAGATLTVDRLTDELWPVDPPPSAASNIKTYVWALRKALRAPVIERRDGGYRIDVTGHYVDLHELRERSQEGYAALRRADGTAALDAFERALA